MKLDKIKFARLIAYIASVAHCSFDDHEVQAIDDLIDIEAPEVSNIYPQASDIDYLMVLIVEGTRKIDAIKMYRKITRYGLKESKDAVEKYWVSKSFVGASADATLGDILNKAGK